jgi:hypothetical protein
LASLRDILEEDRCRLRQQILDKWDVVVHDPGLAAARTADPQAFTADHVLDLLIDRAASKVPGESVISADLAVQAEPPVTVVESHPVLGQRRVEVCGLCGLVGTVRTESRTHQLFLKWASHPVHQYSRFTAGI